MRIRATVAAVSGALALSALAVPASQAAQPDDLRSTVGQLKGLVQDHAAGPSAKRQALAANANTPAVITKAVVNGGKPIVVSATGSKKVSLSITASDNSGIAAAVGVLWTGKNLDDPNSNGFNQNEELATCKAVNATTSTCTGTFTLTAKQLRNIDATNWNVLVIAAGYDDEDITIKESVSKVKVQRESKLTVNAAPEPVKKGGTITVTGNLTRADWDKNKYVGFGTQSVVLQFRKKSSTAYTNVKGVKSSSTGALKTTVKASEDGYYRWNYLGIASTAPVAVAGDYIDVK
ncbi:DUF5707 domain-containing protein [Streptomyces sp. NPDC059568]|uniref:DUF5707 domain-containing protein n=1 Tax=Streptomyces sp. NPDC059568 TaxID=3346868 RepID=UPI00367C63AE